MITYSFDKKDIKQRVRELTLLRAKWFIIVAIIVIPLMFLCRFVYERGGTTYYVYPIVPVFVICVSCAIAIFVYTRNSVKRQFESCTSEGLIEFSIEKNGDVFIFKNFQNGNIFNFNTEDIVKISKTKRLILVKLKNKMLFEFPERRDVADLFGIKT